MKHSNFIFYSLSFISLFLLSCEKDEPELVASFTINKTSAEVNDSISFTNTSVNATSYTWDFGDGTTSNDENPFHSYKVPGSFTVELTAKDGSKSLSSSQKIEIKAPLIVPGVRIGDLILGEIDNSNFYEFHSENSTPYADYVIANYGFYKYRVIDYSPDYKFVINGHLEGQVIASFYSSINTDKLSKWKDETLIRISIFSSSLGITKDNITVGSTVSDVIDIYGSPDFEDDSIIKYDQGIAFGKSNGKVNFIYVYLE